MACRAVVFDVNGGVMRCLQVETPPSDTDSGELKIVIDGTKYTTAADVSEFEATDFGSTGLARAVSAHLLTLAGVQGTNARIVGGLPFARFYEGAAVNGGELKRRINDFGLPVCSSVAGLFSSQLDAVYPEAAAAAIDHWVSPDGHYHGGINPAGLRTAVIEVREHHSTVVTVEQNLRIVSAQSGPLGYGFADVLSELADVLALTGEDRKLARMAQIAETGRLGGWDPKDVSSEVDGVLSRGVRTLFAAIMRRAPDIGAADVVLLVGPGAKFCRALQSELPRLQIPEEPEYASARGYVKFARMTIDA